uniref:IS1634 family transposase n=1 Tax=Verminephrobacter aporrectodeae TaxID=1110389 RepID=UPI002244DEB1|nr:transposase [Verminephrobacter aporrectodeae]
MLKTIQARVDAGKLSGQDRIGVCVGKIINKHKVAKHFELNIGANSLAWTRRSQAITAEAALDGLYIIRTSLTAQQMQAADCVRNYKSLSNVERAFRSLKTVDLKVRPIHHRLANRVRAHILLCMLAYYVEWHMREAWRELTFADTDQGRARSGGSGQTLRSSAAQGPKQNARQRAVRAQFPHADGRVGHPGVQHLPHTTGRSGRVQLRRVDHRQRLPTARVGTAQNHPVVVRNSDRKTIVSR